jgi:hypothetical protein
MPDESYPILIGEDQYSLRFEDKDVEEIEKTLSLFIAFHPLQRTYANAALMLWRGLRKKNNAGELVYAIQQGPPGKVMAYQMVKEFCRQFTGIMGMVILYGYFEKALVVSGYFGEPQPDKTPEGKPEGEQPKNSPPPTGRHGKKQHSG